MVGEALDSPGLKCHSAAAPPNNLAQDWNPIVRLTRKKLDPEVGSMYTGGRGQGFGLASLPPPSIHLPMPESTMYQPHQKSAKDWNPIGRLKRKKLDSEVGLMCNVGRGQGFGMAPSYRHPSTFLGQSPQCLSPTKKKVRTGTPWGALSETSWIPK
jgi:hypothetical protein